MKKLIKVIYIILIVLTLTMCFQMINNKVYGLDDIIDTEQNEYKPDSLGRENMLTKRVGVIVTAIRNVGIIVSVIALMIIGIKTMVASAEEKADYKKSLPGYILGVFMVALMSFIPATIYTIVENISKTA